MDIDPTTNLVVFDIEGRDEPCIASGPTRDDDCVEQAWSSAPEELRASPHKVTRIYSEWEPSAADADFIRRTFPRAELTFSFERPGPDGWDAALAAARRELEQQEAEERCAPRAEPVRHGSAWNG